MKKVLVLAAALALAATPVFASSIVGSKHDLRQGQPGGDSTFVDQNGSTTQVCVFCHTPHGASTTVKPLWNRSKSVTIGNLYNSATLDQTNSRPTVVASKVAASDAKLCISCHDGANVISGLLNPPNDGAAPQVTYGGTGFGTSQLSIGTDLTNDHPIGMNYSAVAAASGATEFVAVPSGITFYDGGVMWCSSCHDVHNDANAPFLAKDNAGSGLCVSCHVK